jgi:hypothetical protein
MPIIAFIDDMAFGAAGDQRTTTGKQLSARVEIPSRAPAAEICSNP